MYKRQVLDLNSAEGAKKLVGVSRCYRAEAGARGKDTKGLYRVHEFTKVELFCWSKPENSSKILEEIKQLQISTVEELGLSAKVLNMPSNDLGNPAFKKYDIEAWMPGRGKFGEISSASNCTDFQGRRLNTKHKNGDTGKLEYVHTLNGTATVSYTHLDVYKRQCFHCLGQHVMGELIGMKLRRGIGAT